MSEYTTDWFSYSIPVWRDVVVPNLRHGAGRKFLELGSYEGRSAEWLLDNVMSPGDELTCVDIWRWDEAEKRFDENVGHRVKKVKRDGTQALLSLVQMGEKFDCIYIDGDHNGRVVLENAVIAWMLLPIGGVMVFDDYRYAVPMQYSMGSIDTRFGIDAFLDCYTLKIRVLHKTAQVVLVRCEQ